MTSSSIFGTEVALWLGAEIGRLGRNLNYEFQAEINVLSLLRITTGTFPAYARPKIFTFGGGASRNAPRHAGRRDVSEGAAGGGWANRDGENHAALLSSTHPAALIYA